jgi:hypothetical protein
MVKVHYDEGVATHVGPESCGHPREGAVEALTGVRAGQPLSGESKLSGAHAVTVAEGNTTGRDNASASPTRRRQRPWHVRTPSAREPGDLYHRPRRMSLRGPHREGTRQSR